MDIPDNVLEAEKLYSYQHFGPQIKSLRAIDPPSHVCLPIKVIYNDDWVQQVGRGYNSLAYHRIIEVLNEAETVFNTRFSHGKRFGTVVEFILVGGKQLQHRL